MAAITGNYAAPNKGIQQWALDWLRVSHHWSTPRFHLATQLGYIRNAHGNREASEFRNYLLWVGVYPCKLRKA